MNIRRRVAIIKAVGNACNLRCRYCFYSGSDQRKLEVMDEGLLESFFQQYFELFPDHAKFVWHGGEPLLAGIEFYENAIRLQKKYMKVGGAVENLIQTNATLIDAEWARFFKEKSFRVGVSIDGGRESHNRQRLNVAGKGSFDEVVRGIAELRRCSVHFGAIQTLTKSNVAALREDIRFFLDELKISGWSVNLFSESSSAQCGLAEESLQVEDVAVAFSLIISEWLERDDASLRLREVENFVAGAMGRRAKTCSFNGTCANYFCLDASGLVWPCDRLSGNPRFLLGDLREQPLRTILSGEASERHAACAAELSSDCHACKWKSACHNGCTALRDPLSKKYVFCEARQGAFSAVEALLTSSLAAKQ